MPTDKRLGYMAIPPVLLPGSDQEVEISFPLKSGAENREFDALESTIGLTSWRINPSKSNNDQIVIIAQVKPDASNQQFTVNVKFTDSVKEEIIFDVAIPRVVKVSPPTVTPGSRCKIFLEGEHLTRDLVQSVKIAAGQATIRRIHLHGDKISLWCDISDQAQTIKFMLETCVGELTEISEDEPIQVMVESQNHEPTDPAVTGDADDPDAPFNLPDNPFQDKPGPDSVTIAEYRQVENRKNSDRRTRIRLGKWLKKLFTRFKLLAAVIVVLIGLIILDISF